MTVSKHILELETTIDDPRQGLSDEIFLLASRIVPMINVDLLIKKPGLGTLLTWREEHDGQSGWHVPGGIIRWQETIATRIHEVARLELGTAVKFKPTPLVIKEFILPKQRNRSHFISMLFKCRIIDNINENIRYREGRILPGQWLWHKQCPENLLPIHEIYRSFI
ncbi:MAG: NUDIX hydrolase [Lentisphaerae bacterium]|jgi:colanic acid biosynthesis protein WcaH|nr:hypothetical protein [Victivallaceae bacterium]MDD5664444.1 hypothetical protein [Victivallaceae bacterium]NLK82808.1 NUDIX hydrolase [Lentisphaerota bacterium]